MKQYIHKGDILFALLLSFFLNWNTVLMVKEHSWLNTGRLLMAYIVVALALEVMFALIGYMIHRPLFGTARSTYFSWRRTLPAAAVLNTVSVLFYYINLPAPFSTLQIILMAVGFVVGMVLTMLYFYSLVGKN